MTDSNIINWIKQSREAGFSDEQIKNSLKNKGWNTLQTELAFNEAEESKTSSSDSPYSSAKEIEAVITHQKTGKTNKIDKKKIILISVVIIVALVIGGGVYAYFKGYLPMPFGNKDAQAMLMKSFDKLAKSDGGEIGVNFQIVSENRSAGMKPFDFSLEEVVGEAGPRAAAKDATAMSDLSQLKTALVLYADDNDNTYPDSISEVAPAYITKIPEHPDGEAYQYTVSEDNKSYELSSKCLNGSVEKIIYKSDGSSTRCESSGASLDISYLSFFDGIMQWIPSDLDINGQFFMFTNNADEAKDREGIYSLTGSLSTGGTTFSVDGELRQKDGVGYAQIRQFPSLFFFDVSALKDKWILLDPEEDSSVMGLSLNDFDEEISDQLPNEEETEKLKKEMLEMVNIAFETELISVKKSGEEKIENHPTNIIKINIDASMLPDFVSKYKESASKREIDLKNLSTFGDIEEMLDRLSQPNFVNQATAFFQNTTFTAWIDQTGNSPRKITCDIIVVPPEKLEKLKDKQIRFSIGLDFDHLGDDPNVSKPNDVITLDEVERLLTGITEEEQMMEKQISAVRDIRSALSSYYYANEYKYPEKLEELLENKPNKTNINMEPRNYFYGSVEEIPTSVYDDSEFVYSGLETNYTLKYKIMKTEEQNSGSDDYDLFGSSYYAAQVVNGENTATKDYLSMEAEETKDSDGDGLTDLEEEEYGTSKYSADTDYDGYTDKEEIDAGYDPLKKPE